MLTIMHRLKYNRAHLEAISGDLYLKPGEAPERLQPVTDWAHFRNAMILGMSADTLSIQQAIEKLATTACRAKLFRADDGKLFAGFILTGVSFGTAFMFYPPVLNMC